MRKLFLIRNCLEFGLNVNRDVTLFPLQKMFAIVACVAFFMSAAQGQTFKILYTFSGGADGANPEAAVILNSAGNIYGTTSAGGDFGFGTVFELSPVAGGGWTESVLHSFAGAPDDGARPLSPVTLFNGMGDDAGALFGTTSGGGKLNNGIVFKLKTDGELEVIHSFTGAADGGHPYYGSLSRDSSSNLYGTTSVGGPASCINALGCGVIFMINRSHVLTVLEDFTFNPPFNKSGAYPVGGIIRDSAGNFYGTTYGGGTGNGGVVFKLDKSGHETVLYNFSSSVPDGSQSSGDVVLDKAGNIYGTTSSTNTLLKQFGTVFKLDPSGAETLLHVFTGTSDGAYPMAGLIADQAGNLYGTTETGGGFNSGTAFTMSPSGTLRFLHRFTGGTDGGLPMGALFRDAAGNLYGTASQGGSGFGVVFEISP